MTQIDHFADCIKLFGRYRPELSHPARDLRFGDDDPISLNNLTGQVVIGETIMEWQELGNDLKECIKENGGRDQRAIVEQRIAEIKAYRRDEEPAQESLPKLEELETTPSAAPQPDPAPNEAADPRRKFLESVLPWDVEGLCSVHWHRPESPFQGRSYKTIEKILVAAELLSKLQTNIYFCLSRHSGRRLQETATALRAIWFDIDVDETGKDPKKYATLEEAIAAFWIFARLSASPIRAGWWLRVAAFMSIGSTLERFRSKNGNHMPKGSKQRPASGG